MVDGSGKNVFHYAAEAEKPDVLNYLIPKSKSEEKTVDTDDERGETDVSHYAAEEKQPDNQNLHLVVKTIAYNDRKLNIFQFMYSQ